MKEKNKDDEIEILLSKEKNKTIKLSIMKNN
jgi:hypothetical protein